MDQSLFAGLPPWLAWSLLVALLGLKILLATTATPPPNTTWGRVYRVVEVLSLVVGRVKQVGVPVPTVADLSNAFGQVLAQAQAAGRPLDPGDVARALGIALPTAPLGQGESTAAPPAVVPAAPVACGGTDQSGAMAAGRILSVLVAVCLGLSVLAGLSACSVTTSPQTSAQRVYALEADYNAAGSMASAYVHRSDADPVAVGVIRGLDQAAFDAVTAARAAVRSGDDPRISAAIAAGRDAVQALLDYLKNRGA